MSLKEIEKKVELIKFRIATINAELLSIDYAIKNVESPDDSVILVGLFDKKIKDFIQLEDEFKAVLEEYNELSKKENNVVSFTAKKLLKAIN
jgi:uncharacterized protein YPO0396